LIEAKLAELNQTITLHQLHGTDAALPIMLSNTGKTLMDNVRAITADIRSQQNNMLDLDSSFPCIRKGYLAHECLPVLGLSWATQLRSHNHSSTIPHNILKKWDTDILHHIWLIFLFQDDFSKRCLNYDATHV